MRRLNNWRQLQEKLKAIKKVNDAKKRAEDRSKAKQLKKE